MICDACRQEIEDKFEILLDKNVSGMVICSVCLESDQPTYIKDQIEWLEKAKKATDNVLSRHSEAFEKLDD
jgi:protein-arginine kinase activator protein McsA